MGGPRIAGAGFTSGLQAIRFGAPEYSRPEVSGCQFCRWGGMRQDTFNRDLVALLPNLRRFALSLCRAPDVADDLVQTTVERALKARAQFDPATRLDAWLFRILRNAWIDMTRRTRTRGETVDVEESAEAISFDGREVTEMRLMAGSAAEAIRGLPEEQQAVMLLVCGEDMSYGEAAEVLGIPVGTVMSRLSRARLAVAKKLGIKS